MLGSSCRELGGSGCSFVGRGTTQAAVKKAIFAHAAKAHPEKLRKMTAKEKAAAGLQSLPKARPAESAGMELMMDKLLSKRPINNICHHR